MSVTIRYIVTELDSALAFYQRLGFAIQLHPGPGFAMLSRGELRLALNVPGGGGGAGQTLSGGASPEPGGWNRFQLEVDDLAATVAELTAAGVRFRGDIVHGRGGDQAIANDPAGNPVELFQPA